MPAASDCELIQFGFWGQPVNALSSLAFVLVGVAIIRSRPVLGVASGTVGIGSLVFHGPMPSWAEWAHNWSLALVIVALLLEHRPWFVAGAGVTLGVGFAAIPESAQATTFVLAAALIVILLLPTGLRVPRQKVLAFGLLAAGAGVMALSRTAGPWCRPGSLLQGHALWHLLAATALWLWAQVSDPPGTARVPVHDAN